jgi:hypothetical protein
MKNLTTVALLCLLAACTKTDVPNTHDHQPGNPQSCGFGITEFNLTKRPPVDDGIVSKPPKGGGGGNGNGNGNGNGGNGNGGGGSTPSTSAVILLDFDGHIVSGTSWNYNGPINCSPANMTSAAMQNILDRVVNDYSPFNVIITTDESIYTAANPYKRMRVIFTESWEWFGQAGGVAFINSIAWGDNTPCFVFTSLLNYNEKAIAEAASHEAGHTFGLHHQAAYNGTTMVSQYNPGLGSGETSWAPIMGVGYYRNVTTWHNGPTPYGYNSLQDDAAIINTVAGAITDDHSNTANNASALNSYLAGVINSSTDEDYFSVNLSSSKTLSVIPFNVGAGNNGANVDIILKIYNTQNQLLASVNDPASLQAITSLNAGQYYISVSATPNSNTGTYGMRGRYTISIN